MCKMGIRPGSEPSPSRHFIDVILVKLDTFRVVCVCKQGHMLALGQSSTACTSGSNMEADMNISRSFDPVVVLMWKLFG